MHVCIYARGEAGKGTSNRVGSGIGTITLTLVLCHHQSHHVISITGGSRLSHTAVEPDSHLAWIFVAKFLCIIKLIIIIG